MTDACGNFGAPPQPPWMLSKLSRSEATASSSGAPSNGSCDGASNAPPASRGATFSPWRADVLALGVPGVGDGAAAPGASSACPGARSGGK